MSRWHEMLQLLHEDGAPVENVQNVQNAKGKNVSEQIEHSEHSGRVATSKAFDADAFTERAAIIEANGVPRAWADGFARLDMTRPPDSVSLGRWRLFIDDCGHFLDGGWAKQAAALGWVPLHLFGCDRDCPLMRIDHAGLIWLIEGRKLVAMTGDTAVIECQGGNRLTFYRHPAAVGQVVLAWDLAGLSVA